MSGRIAIIGLGTLGGFIAQTISELNFLKKLILIDFDIIEEKNLINSIYRKCDVGRYKTTSLHDIIKEQNGNNIEIEIITEKYKECELIIPEVDLIIDCRDYVCNRGDKIDVRLFISSRYLVIDCRKNTSYDKSYEGRYITQLTKNDLRRAALIFTSFMQDGFLDYMRSNQIIKEIDLDYLHKVSNDIKHKNEDRNVIIDSEISKKLLNLEENINNILEENQHKDIIVTLGDKRTSPLSKMIPKNTIKNPYDIISIMTKMTNTPCTSQYYYIVLMSSEQNICNIELLPETGAA
jgi:hypothetical protein